MCIATKLLNEMEMVVGKINTEWERLSQLQSQLEVDLNKQYHKIEKSDFSASEGYYRARELQIILRKRRVVKKELYTLRRMKEMLNMKAVNNNIPKAKKSLTHIHKNNAIDNWQDKWKDNFKAEEMQVQH